MSKQIYIDSEGNEIQVSGTVNSADMLPFTAGSSKMTSEAIGSLSFLTTTNKDRLVDAVNEVNGNKADKEWTLVDEKQGSTAIALPNGWNELFVICRYGNSGGKQLQLTTGVIIPSLAGTYAILGGGSLLTQVYLNALATEINMIYFEINNTDFTSTSYFTVYYR